MLAQRKLLNIVIELDILIGLYHFSKKHLLGKMFLNAFSLYVSMASFILVNFNYPGWQIRTSSLTDLILYMFITKHSLSLQRMGS